MRGSLARFRDGTATHRVWPRQHSDRPAQGPRLHTRHTVGGTLHRPPRSRTSPLSTGAGTIAIPQLGFGVWQVPDADVDAADRDRARRRLPQHRHGPPLRQRGRASAAPSRRPTCPATSCSSPPRCGTTTTASTRRWLPSTPRWAARPRRPRPLPHPLADAGAGQLRRHLEGAAQAARGRPGPRRRRLQLRDRPPAAARGRDRRAPRHQPGRAAPLPPAGAAARVPRAHGILTEAWSPLASGGVGARRRRDPRDRRQARRHAGAGDPALAHSSSATS